MACDQSLGRHQLQQVRKVRGDIEGCACPGSVFKTHLPIPRGPHSSFPGSLFSKDQFAPVRPAAISVPPLLMSCGKGSVHEPPSDLERPNLARLPSIMHSSSRPWHEIAAARLQRPVAHAFGARVLRSPDRHVTSGSFSKERLEKFTVLA